jgi:DNA-binding MarR family transcriptional regulator
MASLKEMRLAKYAEIDAAVTRISAEKPRTITRDIAEQLGVSYNDVTRSYKRLGIVRSNGRPRRKVS